MPQGIRSTPRVRDLRQQHLASAGAEAVASQQPRASRRQCLWGRDRAGGRDGHPAPSGCCPLESSCPAAVCGAQRRAELQDGSVGRAAW